jgi:dihydrofolate reductase
MRLSGASARTQPTRPTLTASALTGALAVTRNVYVVGGARIDQQLLSAGLVDELWLTVVPVMLGDGVRLFERIDGTPLDLDQTQIGGSTNVARLRYRIPK